MSVEWKCSHCFITYRKKYKFCSICDNLLQYHCQLSNQKRRYNNYKRHKKHCIYCTPSSSKKIQSKIINNTINILHEIKNTDTSKSLYIIYNIFNIFSITHN